MSLLIGGGELWECAARNNSQVLKSGTFDPDIIYKKDPHGLPRQVFLAIIYSVLSVLYYSQSLENASATN